MTDENTAVDGEQDDNFEAAFDESAKVSEDENREAPGKGGAIDAEQEEEDFGESFSDAATAASKSEPEEIDLAQKFADLEAETERLRQSERSQRGRVSALTKKLVEQRAAEKPPTVDKTSAGTADKDDDWEEFQREFPEMAAIVDKRMANVTRRVDSVNERMERVSTTQETLVEKEINAYRETQFDILAERHPDFKEIATSKDFAEFRANAPGDIQQRINSDHAEDAIAVLDAFKEMTGWGRTARKTHGKSEIEQLNEKRAAALKRSAGVSVKRVGHSARQNTATDDDDFDAAFAESASKKEKERSLYR